MAAVEPRPKHRCLRSSRLNERRPQRLGPQSGRLDANIAALALAHQIGTAALTRSLTAAFRPALVHKLPGLP